MFNIVTWSYKKDRYLSKFGQKTVGFKNCQAVKNESENCRIQICHNPIRVYSLTLAEDGSYELELVLGPKIIFVTGLVKWGTVVAT